MRPARRAARRRASRRPAARCRARLQGALAAGCVGAALLGTAACGPASEAAAPRSQPTLPSTTTAAPTQEPTPPELPRGGRAVFPAYRLVGFAGAPGSPALGRLGVGSLEPRVREIERTARPYAVGRQAQPVMELIATVVQGSPGADGKYRYRQPDRVIDEYLAQARRHQAILLLGIQPGRSTFLTEVKHYEKWLREPDVGLALDPEWAMSPSQVPMRVFGHTTGPELNRVTAWVAALVARDQLPEKVVVFHQLAGRIVRQESAIRPRPGVALVKSVDGIGSRAMKEDTWRKLTKSLPKGVHPGFKLFFAEDREHGALMTPSQVLALKPTPEYVLYE
jgi:hypothetical protein